MSKEEKQVKVNDVGHGEDSVSIESRIEIKESGYGIDVVLVSQPRNVIIDALAKKEWFKGIVLSATYLEHFGLEKLSSHFKGKISTERLKRLSLESIITLLFGCGLIDQNTYSRMIEIKDTRNTFVHQPWANVTISDKEGETILKKALQCLEAFGI